MYSILNIPLLMGEKRWRSWLFVTNTKSSKNYKKHTVLRFLPQTYILDWESYLTLNLFSFIFKLSFSFPEQVKDRRLRLKLAFWTIVSGVLPFKGHQSHQQIHTWLGGTVQITAARKIKCPSDPVFTHITLFFTQSFTLALLCNVEKFYCYKQQFWKLY